MNLSVASESTNIAKSSRICFQIHPSLKTLLKLATFLSYRILAKRLVQTQYLNFALHLAGKFQPYGENNLGLS